MTLKPQQQPQQQATATQPEQSLQNCPKKQKLSYRVWECSWSPQLGSVNDRPHFWKVHRYFRYCRDKNFSENFLFLSGRFSVCVTTSSTFFSYFLLWVVKTLVFTLVLLLVTHARLRTHDATPGNISYVERSLFSYFLTYVSHVRFSTIYTCYSMKYIHSTISYILVFATY